MFVFFFILIFYFLSVMCTLVSWPPNTPLFSEVELSGGGAVAVAPVPEFPATLLMSGRR